MPNPNALKSDDTVMIKVTTIEAHMIKLVRAVPYGEVIITTRDSKPIRVDSKESVLLKADGAKELIVIDE